MNWEGGFRRQPRPLVEDSSPYPEPSITACESVNGPTCRCLHPSTASPETPRERGSGNRLEGIVRTFRSRGRNGVDRPPSPARKRCRQRSPDSPSPTPTDGRRPHPATAVTKGSLSTPLPFERGEDGVVRLHRHAPESIRRPGPPGGIYYGPRADHRAVPTDCPWYGIDPGAGARGRRAGGRRRRGDRNRSSGNPRP